MENMKAHFVFIFALQSLLIILLLTDGAIANPVGMYGRKHRYAIITIDSPVYSSQLSFTIRTNYYWATGSNLTDTHCFVILNNNTYEVNNLSIVSNVTIKDDYAYNPYVQCTLKSTIGIPNLTSLASGTYNLKVNYGYYQSNTSTESTTEFVSLGLTTSQIGITQHITSQQPAPSSSPASVTEVPAPASNSSQSLPTINEGSIVPAVLNPMLVISISAVVLAMLVAASILLVYFKRSKSNCYRSL